MLVMLVCSLSAVTVIALMAMAFSTYKNGQGPDFS
jgi:hypothetical protein